MTVVKWRRKIVFATIELFIVLGVSYVIGMATNLVWTTHHMYEVDSLPTPREYAVLSLWWGLVAIFPTWLVLRGLSNWLVGSFKKY